MSKVLAVANFKGGCGKTTSAIDLAVAFVKLGKKVLAVDSDSQGHLTIGFGFPKSQRVTLKDMLENEIMGYEYDPREAVLTSEEGVDVIPSNKLVSGIALNSADSPELVLKGYIDKLRDLYEVIIIDCSPAFGMMNINVLAAADGVIIPTKAEYFGIDGLQEIIGSVRSIKKRFNPDLKIEGILFTMDTGRFNNTKRNKEAVINAYGDEINIYDLTIPNAVAIAEAASEGVSIHSYSGNSQGAKNYLEIAKGVLANG
jgi:chromosome partitioning protein